MSVCSLSGDDRAKQTRQFLCSKKSTFATLDLSQSLVYHRLIPSVLLPQTVADACRTGASTNIIFGLALGYQSCIVPTIVLAVVIFVSFSLANMYGIACAALGMLGTLATGAPCLRP